MLGGTAASSLHLPDRVFDTVLPEDERSSREELFGIATKYFDAVSRTLDYHEVPWGPECERIELGPSPSTPRSAPAAGRQITVALLHRVPVGVGNGNEPLARGSLGRRNRLAEIWPGTGNRVGRSETGASHERLRLGDPPVEHLQADRHHDRLVVLLENADPDRIAAGRVEHIDVEVAAPVRRGPQTFVAEFERHQVLGEVDVARH